MMSRWLLITDCAGCVRKVPGSTPNFHCTKMHSNSRGPGLATVISEASPQNTNFHSNFKIERRANSKQNKQTTCKLQVGSREQVAPASANSKQNKQTTGVFTKTHVHTRMHMYIHT